LEQIIKRRKGAPEHLTSSGCVRTRNGQELEAPAQMGQIRQYFITKNNIVNIIYKSQFIKTNNQSQFQIKCNN
jgi:hypothetical protein